MRWGEENTGGGWGTPKKYAVLLMTGGTAYVEATSFEIEGAALVFYNLTEKFRAINRWAEIHVVDEVPVTEVVYIQPKSTP